MRWISECREDVTIPRNTSSDSFQIGDKNILLAVSRALKTNNPDTSDVRSIPDVFFKARIYEMMIYSKDEDAYDPFFRIYRTQIEYEWRAMLSVLVLANTIGLNVLTMPIPNMNNASRLEKISLKRLPSSIWTIPDNWSQQKTGWTPETGMMFALKNKENRILPIAISSPNTIIVPVAEGWKFLKEIFIELNMYSNSRDDRPDWIKPWDNDAPKTIEEDDPARLLNRDFAHIMWSWLSDYQKYLAKYANDVNLCNQDYAKALCGPINATDRTIGIITRYKNDLQDLYNFSYKQEVYNYNHISDILTERKNLDYSDVMMFSCDGNKRLFIDCERIRDNNEIGGKKTEEIKAYGVLSLSALFHARELRNKELNSRNIFPCFSDELLMDSISTIFFDKVKDGVPAKAEDCATVVLDGQGVKTLSSTSLDESGCYFVAMPLTDKGRKLFELYANTEMPIKYRIDIVNLQTIKVTLYIPMQSGCAGVVNGYYEWSREYVDIYTANNQNGMIKQTALGHACEAGIWPNRQIEGWNTYFLFCYQASKQTDSIAYVEPFKDDITSKYEYVSPLGGDEKIHYYHLNKFPILINAYNGKGEKVGYVPLNSRIISPPSVDGKPSYRAYIDFGTSATVIYRKIDGKMQRVEKFSGGTALASGVICHNPDVRSVNGECYNQFFIPDKSVEVPFPSLLHDLLSSKENELRKHVLHSRIFFKQLVKTYKNPVHGFVISNLKWSNSEINSFRMNTYFQHLARLIGLDAHINGCTSLSLYLSYPGAMNKYEEYISRIKEMFKSTLKIDTNKVDFTQSYHITEGQAAAQHFNTNIVPARCVIDIGGGSSDLFLYVQKDSNNTMGFEAKDSSIKIGARDVLVRVLREDAEKYRVSEEYKKTYLYRLASSPSIELYDDKDGEGCPISLGTIKAIVDKAGSEEQFVTELEEFFARPYTTNTETITIGDKLYKALEFDNDDHIRRDREFLTLLAVNIAATVYYSGIMARGIEHDFESIELAFAGNGSKMLHWLGGIEVLTKFLRRIFFHAISRKDLVPQMTAKSKAEKDVDNYKIRLFEATSALNNTVRARDEQKNILNDEIKKVERLENAIKRIQDARISDAQTESELKSARESVLHAEECLKESEDKVKIAQIKLDIEKNAKVDADEVLTRCIGALTVERGHLEDSKLGTVSVRIEGNGKLAAAHGMSCDEITNVESDRLIVAGEVYSNSLNSKVDTHTAESSFDKDSIVVMDGDRYVSSGISYTTVKEDEFIAFCHAFNSAIKDAFGNTSVRQILTLNIFPIKNEDIGPSFEIGEDVWRGMKKNYLNTYFTKVLEEKQGRGTTEDLKSLFYIEVQALVDIMLGKFGVDR